MSQVKTGNQVFTSAGDMAEAFNNYFTNIGRSLAQEIPSSKIDPLRDRSLFIAWGGVGGFWAKHDEI